MTTAFPHLPAETWQRFLADELQDDARARVESHLDSCEACLAALEAADASFLFRRLRGEAAATGVLDGLWDDIAAEIRDLPAGGGDASRPAWNARLLLAGVAAALAVVLSLGWMARPGQLDGAGMASAQPGGLAPARPSPSSAPADPCPAVVAASLRLTREECAALYGGPIEAGEPAQVLVSASFDLRGL